MAEINTGRAHMGSRAAGTQTAGLIFGGVNTYPGTNQLAVTESWNGSAWTEVNDLNTARVALAGSGSSTAALAIGGQEPPDSAKVEIWDGSSWTETGDLNTARRFLGGSGTTISSLAFGGSSPNKANTESWDGSSWTEVADLASARYGFGAGGTNNTSAIGFGGYTSTNVSSTEEWTVNLSNKTITSS